MFLIWISDISFQCCGHTGAHNNAEVDFRKQPLLRKPSVRLMQSPGCHADGYTRRERMRGGGAQSGIARLLSFCVRLRRCRNLHAARQRFHPLKGWSETADFCYASTLISGDIISGCLAKMSKIEKANSRSLSSAGLVVCCPYGQGLPSVALLVSPLKVPFQCSGGGKGVIQVQFILMQSHVPTCCTCLVFNNNKTQF